MDIAMMHCVIIIMLLSFGGRVAIIYNTIILHIIIYMVIYSIITYYI